MDTATARTTELAPRDAVVEVTTIDRNGNPLADIFVGTDALAFLAATERAASAIADPCSRVAGYLVNGVKATR